jgi:hypothetical protein
VHRYGVIALAVLAGVLLIAVDAATARLIPLYAIGVFIGFTISQTGLVRHWHGQRSPRWALRAALNGAGAVLTATAAAVFIASKFTSGAWVVVVTVPALTLLFSRIESYYRAVGRELDLGEHPDRPLPAKSLVIVPVGSISNLTEHALHAALSLSDDVIAVSVHPQAAQSAAFRAAWDRWNPGVRLDTLNSPHRSLVHPIVDYVRQAQQDNRQIAVLIPEVQPPPLALPDPAKPAGLAAGDRTARQHRRRHLHHPLPAHDTIAQPPPGHPHPRTKDRPFLPRPDCRWSRSPPAPSAQVWTAGWPRADPNADGPDTTAGWPPALRTAVRSRCRGRLACRRR